jgi:aryl-alcohol dehydrogenase-like predicted oxidoreductase
MATLRAGMLPTADETQVLWLSARVASTASLMCLPGDIALAWLLARGSDIVSIPSTSRIAKLEEKVAVTAVRLDPSKLELIERIAASECYATAGMASDNRGCGTR